MLFSSFLFLFCFLPLTLLLYFLLPACLSRICSGRMSTGAQLFLRNVILLVASLLFYGWGEPLFVLLMLGTVAADFFFGLWLARSRRPRTVLWLATLFNLGLLFYFKYAAFFGGLLGVSVSATRMPLGISFYTFQALSYVVDVYYGRVRAARDPIAFGTYVALFPQLIAGPIVRYSDVAVALKSRRHGVHDAASGARRFIAGLTKKMLIANPAGALFAMLVEKPTSELFATGAWLALVAFAIQIYFDFSGYSDMAVGLGRIFGFSFPENFNYPYTAVSITDFWRRWHITLSAFFKEYVYIPLGGNRRGGVRTVINLFVVWFLTGLWHGAAWNFILWGLYYLVLLLVEKFLLARFLPHVPRPLRHTLTLLGILFGWLLFVFDGSSSYLTLSALGAFLGTLFGRNGLLGGNELYELVRHLPFLAIAALAATPVPRAAYRTLVQKRAVLAILLPVLALFFSLAYLADATYNPFLYFRF